jgi:pimeloyl-ACP methyl ester carboxylesterase
MDLGRLDKAEESIWISVVVESHLACTSPSQMHRNHRRLTTRGGIKSSKFRLLDDCGHFPFSEQPQKTTQAVLDFLRGR